MKISKIFAGMSAAAIIAAAVAMPASAEAPVEKEFYPATGEWTYTYSGSDIQAAIDANGAQLSENKSEDGSPSTWTCGMNIQVGHMKNAKVTMTVHSDTNNIYKGADAEAGSDDTMWTVQTSWNADAPADKEKSTVKYTENEAKGATELNNWDSGPTKFNGQWAQFMLTDNDLSGVTITVKVVADDATTWEYHKDNEEKPEENVYRVFIMFGKDAAKIETVENAEINKQIEGEGTTSSGDGSTTSSSSSSGSSSGSSSSSASSSSKGGSNGGSTSKGSATTSSAKDIGASDNTANAESGAAAGVGLAIAALAGAAIVVSRKK